MARLIQAPRARIGRSCDDHTMTSLEGHRVGLRSLRPADLDAMLVGRKKLADEGSIESVPDRERLRSQLAQWSRLRDGRVNLGIECDGRLVGEVQCFLPPDCPPTSGSRVEVGVSIYDTADRGLGLGTEAVRCSSSGSFGKAWIVSRGVPPKATRRWSRSSSTLGSGARTRPAPRATGYHRLERVVTAASAPLEW